MSPAIINSLKRWIGSQVRLDTTDDSYWVGALKEITENGDLLLVQRTGPGEEDLLEAWFYGAAIVRVRLATDEDLSDDDDDQDEQDDQDGPPGLAGLPGLEEIFSQFPKRR